MGEPEVQEFISITGSSRGVALRMLDATGGDLQEAIEKFYADGGASASVPQPAARKPSGGGSRSGGIRSLGDVNNEEEDSDDDDHNDYYVGGEKSGQIVRGAPKDDGRGDKIEDIFEGARAAGAKEGRPADLYAGERPGGFQAFGGRPRTLAGGDAAPPPEEEEAEKEITVTIAFYANGIFTVNDGTSYYTNFSLYD